MRRLLLLVPFLGAFALACGGSGQARIPVDSPVKPWEAPELETAEDDGDGDDPAAPSGEPDEEAAVAPAATDPSPAGVD
jgi:hypothetical protein